MVLRSVFWVVNDVCLLDVYDPIPGLGVGMFKFLFGVPVLPPCLST